MKRKGRYVQLSFDFKPWDDEEIWKDIKGYDGLYQVSNLGRVKSLNYNHTGKEKILKLKKEKCGYLRVNLYKNGKREFYYVHRLVYEAFFGEIPNGMQVNHKDENKENNVLSNIDTLMTPKENNNWGTHNERVGKANRISLKNNKNRSKSVVQKNLQGEVIKVWESTREIQRKLGYDHSYICCCCKGKFTQSYGYIWKYEEAV